MTSEGVFECEGPRESSISHKTIMAEQIRGFSDSHPGRGNHAREANDTPFVPGISGMGRLLKGGGECAARTNRQGP